MKDMTAPSLRFDAIAEAQPGPRWRERWDLSWPSYRRWFLAHGGRNGPSRAECEAALARHMPELLPVWRRLVACAGGDDLAARFLSTWCPPAYMGGCSIAARASDSDVRLVRNYDLAPELNEGFLLRSEWCGRPVMGMVEFLWGLSDGINAAGLAVAIAYGGRRDTAPGFGITTILRYVLETCDDVPAALAALRRVPSHMAYNVVLADAEGRMASVELRPGGGYRASPEPLATNHQHEVPVPAHDRFRTLDRRAHLERELPGTEPAALSALLRAAPLFQTDYRGGFGTLFTADYDCRRRQVTLLWPGEEWVLALDGFAEGHRTIHYEAGAPVTGFEQFAEILPVLPEPTRRALGDWLGAARSEGPDWAGLGAVFASWGAGLSAGGAERRAG